RNKNGQIQKCFQYPALFLFHLSDFILHAASPAPFFCLLYVLNRFKYLPVFPGLLSSALRPAESSGQSSGPGPSCRSDNGRFFFRLCLSRSRRHAAPLSRLLPNLSPFPMRLRPCRSSSWHSR